MSPARLAERGLSMAGSLLVQAVLLSVFAGATSRLLRFDGADYVDPAAFDLARSNELPGMVFAPAPLAGPNSPTVRLDPRSCASPPGDVVPARLLRQAPVTPGWRGRRDVRLCLRVDRSGQVVSARTLVSSGDRRTDAAAELLAGQLAFAPARRGGAAIPSTLTYDVTGLRPAVTPPPPPPPAPRPLPL